MSNVLVRSSRVVIAALAALGAACAPVQAPSVTQGTAPGGITAPVTGWYVQDAARASLQPCGTANHLTVVNGGELRKQAADFGLQAGDPVYVRVQGIRTAGEFQLGRVEQFGSPTPIRDCPMSGTMIQ